MRVEPHGLGGQFVACLLALGLTGCTGAPGPASSPSPSLSPSPSPSPVLPAPRSSGAAATTHDHVVATRRFSAWLLHAVPMPPGAREWHRSPTAHYRRGSVGIGPSDPRFTRTTWWTVSLSSDALVSWLRHHAPRALRPEPGSGASVESMGVWERDQDFVAPSTRAHTSGWVNFAFMPRGDGLVVRADTFVAARFARTVLVPSDATSVRIRRTERSTRPHPRPHRALRTVRDPRAVAALVEMVNALPGAMTTAFVASCPSSVTQQRYSMTFASPHGQYVASLPTTNCWPRLALERDGERAGPPLDPGPFTRAADGYLGPGRSEPVHG
ncbi:MAG: hypothetical protein JWO76_3198 [Nocardioides sp.]|nr:hypothetical protein [Nocardioides sp.]